MKLSIISPPIRWTNSYNVHCATSKSVFNVLKDLNSLSSSCNIWLLFKNISVVLSIDFWHLQFGSCFYVNQKLNFIWYVFTGTAGVTRLQNWASINNSPANMTRTIKTCVIRIQYLPDIVLSTVKPVTIKLDWHSFKWSQIFFIDHGTMKIFQEKTWSKISVTFQAELWRVENVIVKGLGNQWLLIFEHYCFDCLKFSYKTRIKTFEI